MNPAMGFIEREIRDLGQYEYQAFREHRRRWWERRLSVLAIEGLRSMLECGEPEVFAMQDSSSRVRIGRAERPEEIYSSLEDEAGLQEDATTSNEESLYKSHVRRGAMWGGLAGFGVGMMPLMFCTILGAIAGAVITRASHLRIDRVSAPRIHFARRTGGGQH